MSHAPPVPKDQPGVADKGARTSEDALNADRHQHTGVQPGDANVNLDTQGRFGNLKQNLTNRWKVQDR